MKTEGPSGPAMASGHHRRIREGGWVTLLAALSKLAGLGRELALAGLFGTSAAADAFRVAWSGANLPLQILGGSPLENTAVPQLRGLLARDRERAAGATASVILLALTVGALLILGLVALWARELVSLLAPGFDLERVAVCARLLRWLILLLPAALAGRLFMIVSFAMDRFRISALRPLLVNMALLGAAAIASVTAELRWFAWAPALAWCAHLWFLWRDLRGRWRWRLSWSDAREPARRLAALLPLSVAATFCDQGFALADQIVGSTLGGGSVAALEYARFIAETPLATIGTGLVIVALPLLAEWVALGKQQEIHRGAERVLAPSLLILTPMAVFLFLGSGPLIALVYGRGAFGPDAHAGTAAALAGLSLGLWAQFAAYFLYRLYYASGRFGQLTLYLALALGLNIALNLLLAPRWGLWGIAAATSSARLLLLALTASALPADLRGRLGRALLHLLLGAAVFVAIAPGLRGLVPPPVWPQASALLPPALGASILSLVKLGLVLVLFWAIWTLPSPYWRRTWRELLGLLRKEKEP